MTSYPAASGTLGSSARRGIFRRPLRFYDQWTPIGVRGKEERMPSARMITPAPAALQVRAAAGDGRPAVLRVLAHAVRAAPDVRGRGRRRGRAFVVAEPVHLRRRAPAPCLRAARAAADLSGRVLPHPRWDAEVDA